MRVIGLLLVILGGLALGLQSFAHLSDQGRAQREREVSESRWLPSVPPVASGIVVVSGLLLLVSSGRRSEAGEP
jgi:hypothetical protein